MYREIYKRLPYNTLIAMANPPHFTIFDISDFHLKSLKQTRENLIGKDLFEMFPPLDGDLTIIKSFTKVALERVNDWIDVIRYDIPTENGTEVKYWNILNVPFDWQDIKYIANFAIDITPIYTLKS